MGALHKDTARQFEFYFPDIDTHVLVETDEQGVVIHASRDNCSERRKAFFIRELASEGFIPDLRRWNGGAVGRGDGGVRWIIDYSWLKIPPEVKRRSGRFMRRLLVGSSLLCLAMVTILFLTAR